MDSYANCKYKKANDCDSEAKVKVKGTPWKNIISKIKLLSPYLWPRNNLQLQIYVILCILLLISLRVANVYVPILQKEIVDILALQNGVFPWEKLLIFAAVRLLQGGSCRLGGIIICAKNILWIKVEQNAVKNLKLNLFNHLHQLGLRWHYSRKTGEVLRVMDRGTNSVTTVLKTAFFQVIPILADATVAIAALSYELNVYFGLIIFSSMSLFLTIAILGTEYRTKYKRKMNEADNEQRSRSVDSLLNSETVKLYGNEKYEADQFAHYMDIYQVFKQRNIINN